MNPIYWSAKGNTYRMMEAIPGDVQQRLEAGVYHMKYTQEDGVFLYRTGDKFNFPYKIYGKDEDFVKRVVKTWEMSKSSLGVLLTGIKGTGKTVTAELIANEMNLPVIVITDNYGSAMTYFISSIEQECVIFFDEFEKIFAKKEEEDTMLTTMDGVLNSKFRKLFLLTTNTLSISSNFIDRPGRIRYTKRYGNLSRPVVEEIVKDLLQKKEHYDEVVKFIGNLELITIDIVKSVITEVNIHNESPSKFKDVFNTTSINPLFDVYILEKVEGSTIPKEYKIASGIKVSPSKFDKTTVARGIELRTQYDKLGKITRVISPNTVECTIIVGEYKEINGERKTIHKEQKVVYKLESKRSYLYNEDEEENEGDSDPSLINTAEY